MTRVARINSTGFVTLRGPGKTDITITFEATKDYQAATKDVTITVKPKQATLKKVTSKKRKTPTAAWKRDPHATGYRIAVSKNRSFKKSRNVLLYGAYSKAKKVKVK
ncbi:MAG: hypothetical protein HFE75_09185 [Firmicutes bacterium]|jgi:hypothetical protein|nr:hypothetical protein [Bacillota bacterium]NBI63450.1 hypothetical protein [Clostridiales bacterium]